jgi:hypothetical protein
MHTSNAILYSQRTCSNIFGLATLGAVVFELIINVIERHVLEGVKCARILSLSGL